MTIPLRAGFEEHFVGGAPPGADLGHKKNRRIQKLLLLTKPHISNQPSKIPLREKRPSSATLLKRSDP